MEKGEKIADIAVKVPYHSSGNVVREKEVAFHIYCPDGSYVAIPQMDEQERRLANLPPELAFTFHQGKYASKRGLHDGNLHVIQLIVSALKEKKVF